MRCFPGPPALRRLALTRALLKFRGSFSCYGWSLLSPAVITMTLATALRGATTKPPPHLCAHQRRHHSQRQHTHRNGIRCTLTTHLRMNHGCHFHDGAVSGTTNWVVDAGVGIVAAISYPGWCGPGLGRRRDCSAARTWAKPKHILRHSTRPAEVMEVPAGQADLYLQARREQTRSGLAVRLAA